MRWEAVEADAEAVLERIWDLHDKLSDAILAVSRSHFLPAPLLRPHASADRRASGCVFVKGQGGEATAAMAEARSLHAIRLALEDLEDHLEFLHTVQSQQQAECDAAIARLEQSRIVLATRLAEHKGKKYRVIEEALAFVGEVNDKSRFVSPEDVRGQNVEDRMGHGSNIMVRMLSCSVALAKNSFRLERIGGILGNAAVFAVSMLAFLQLHQAAFGSKTPAIEYRDRADNRFQCGSSRRNGKEKHLEVLLARG